MSTDGMEPAPTGGGVEQFRFNGTGSGYFGIWIVNLLLTILTLGIYSAWAKVRRLKYFYGNTELAGASFDYHGEPLSILKGRLIALGLFVLYSVATNILSVWTLVVLVFLAIVMPWLLRNSFRFRMHNSSYRGLRFGFHGTNGGAYGVFLGWLLLMFVTLYIAGPLFHAKLKQYQHGNTRYGTTPFTFTATVGDFYRAYAPVVGLVVLLIVAIAVVLPGSIAAGRENPAAIVGAVLTIFVLVLGGSLLITPLWQARTQNLVWNHTQLGEHRFESDLRVLPLAGIHVTNFLLIVLTVGLFVPWAAVRVARYRAECLRMLPATPLEEFVAAETQAVGATGEETAEMFDFDVGL